MSKRAMIFTGLLSLGMIASYMSWTAEQSASDATAVLLLDAKPEQITQVSWSSEELDVELSRRSDSAGDYLWVKTTERKEVELPPEPTPEPVDQDEESEGEEAELAEPAEPLTELRVTIKEFKAGPVGEDLLASLAPLMAERRLEVDPSKYEDFGLEAPQATLSISRDSKEPRVIEIGGESYGTRDRYALDQDSGQVVLLDQDILRPLKFATSRLPDRDLLGIDTQEIQSVVVERPDAAPVTFNQLNASDSKQATWAIGQDEQGDESAATWMDKALGLRAKGYVQAEDMPTSTQPAMSLRVQREQGEAVVLEILSGVDPEGATVWYARSTYTRELVLLMPSQASDLVADFSSVEVE